MTKRLVLRKARVEDLDDLHAVYSDPQVMRYWSTPPHDDVAQTRRNLTRLIASSDPVVTYFVIECGGRAVGCAGVHMGDEIGFLLRSDHWQQGLMSEALGALIPYFFEDLRYLQLTADADPMNAASVATLRAAGFVQTGEAKNTYCVDGVWTDSVYFTLKPDTRAA
ncbi:GNAT family N-acetyltransferase [Marivita sp.]|uniref:GNAT family N-acetyltransferase n=1 Tax=Marivita sp. TaxID=2003365 RepID=UPI003F6B0B9C